MNNLKHNAQTKSSLYDLFVTVWMYEHKAAFPQSCSPSTFVPTPSNERTGSQNHIWAGRWPKQQFNKRRVWKQCGVGRFCSSNSRHWMIQVTTAAVTKTSHCDKHTSSGSGTQHLPSTVYNPKVPNQHAQPVLHTAVPLRCGKSHRNESRNWILKVNLYIIVSLFKLNIKMRTLP